MYVYIWGLIFAMVDDFYPERSLWYLSPGPAFYLKFGLFYMYSWL